MNKLLGKVLLKTTVVSLALLQLPAALSSDFAATTSLQDKAQFNLDRTSPSELRFQLRGEKHITLYRTEYYESTCTRTESRTAYRTECTPVYREECYDTSREVCHDSSYESCSDQQVCRDVMREVCQGGVCTSYPTRECTTERSCRTIPDRTCTTVPDRECRQVHVSDDCREVPYTEYYDVDYACTKSRQIPIGTELQEDLVGNVLVRIEGDVSALSGKDGFEVSIANGLDVGRADLAVKLLSSADTHLFQLVKINEEKRSLGSKQSEIDAAYLLKIIPVADVLKERTSVVSIAVSKTGMSFSSSGRKIDADTAIHITVRKDQALGGMKTMIDRNIGVAELKIAKLTSGNQKSSINFAALGERKLNGRPHEFTVTISTDFNKVLGGEVLNPGAIEKYRGSFTSSKKVRVNL